MKTFEPKPWVVPQPVLIIGTYNKMRSIWQKTEIQTWRKWN